MQTPNLPRLLCDNQGVVIIGQTSDRSSVKYLKGTKLTLAVLTTHFGERHHGDQVTLQMI